MNYLISERTLKVGSVSFQDDRDSIINRKIELTYSDEFPEKLYLYLLSNNPDDEGIMNGYNLEEVEKLKKFITQVYNLMKGATDGEENKDSS